MKKYYQIFQQCIQVEKPKEQSLEDYYFDYDPDLQTLRVRDGSASGQLIESYTYNDGTQRLTKTNHILNETTYYISDEFIEVRNETGTYLTVYAYDGNTLVGRKDADGTKKFYHPDHLGSTDLITDESQNIAEQTTYDPFGRVRDDLFNSLVVYININKARALWTWGKYAPI